MDESSSYTLDLDVPAANLPVKEEKESPKRSIIAWSILGVCEFCLSIFAIGYVSFVEDASDDYLEFDLSLWLQVYGVVDIGVVLVEGWLMVKLTLSCSPKLAITEIAVAIVATLFFLAWSIVGTVLLLETPADNKVWLFSLIVVGYQLIRAVVMCGLNKL